MMNEKLKKHLESLIVFQRASLAQRCLSLSEHLANIAHKLQRNTPHNCFHVNDLGEVQSRGTIIDAECGRLMSRIEILRMLEEEKI